MKALGLVLVAMLLSGCSKDKPSAPPVSSPSAATWISMGTGLPGDVTCLCVGGDSLYAAARDSLAMGASSIWRLADSTWVRVGPSIDGGVGTMAWFQGQLFIGGWFASAGDLQRQALARWDGVAWQAVGDPLLPIGGAIRRPYVFKMLVWRDRLYIGGFFCKPTARDLCNLAAWDGVTLEATPCSLGVYDLAVWQDQLVVAGRWNFSDVACDPRWDPLRSCLIAWNGTRWSNLGGGIPQAGDDVCASVWAVCADDAAGLIAAGAFSTIGGAPFPSPARWDGQNWSAMGSLGDDAKYFAHLGADLYVADDDYSNPPRVRRWNGAQWDPVGGPFAGRGRWLTTLVAYRGTLFVGGSRMGGVSMCKF